MEHLNLMRIFQHFCLIVIVILIGCVPMATDLRKVGFNEIQKVSDFLSYVNQSYKNQRPLVPGPSKVDKIGEITSHDYHEVPEDLSIFDFESVIQQIRKVYVDVYNG